MGSIVAIVVLIAACGGGGSTVDAALPDAHRDAAPVCSTITCGTTCCATRAYTCSPACTCPSGIVPQPFMTVIDQMDTVRKAPAVLGIGIINGTDSKLHALVIGFDPVTTPVGTGITLPSTPFGGAPFVGLGYDVNVASQTTKSTFFVSQGSMTLTRRCPGGVAGSISGVTLREQTTIDDPTPDPMGCTLAVPDLTFDYGAACP